MEKLLIISNFSISHHVIKSHQLYKKLEGKGSVYGEGFQEERDNIELTLRLDCMCYFCIPTTAFSLREASLENLLHGISTSTSTLQENCSAGCRAIA